MHLLTKPFLIRKVRNPSMAPKLRPGQWIVATRFFRKLRPGEVVVVEQNHRMLIKRIEEIQKTAQGEKLFVIGDNLSASIDSRQFGWLKREAVIARVMRPNLAK